MPALPRLVVLVAVGSLGLVPGFARSQTPQRVELATEVLRAMDLEKAMQAGVAASFDAQIQQNPLMAPFRPTMEAFTTKYLTWEAIGPEMAKLYATHFTEPELRELLAFYRSPIGRKMVGEQGTLTAEGARIAQAALQPHLPELQAAIQQRAAELQRSGQPALVNPAPTTPATKPPQ
jgi:uncharacterized protein